MSIATDRGTPETIRAAPYELFVLALSIFALILFVTETFMPITSGSAAILRYADSGICVVFIIDFIRNVIRAPNKGRYLVLWGWLDLLSSIPTVGVFRFGRAARIIRIVRVLRSFRSARNLAVFLLRRRAQMAFLTTALVSVMLVVVASVAILQFESSSPNATIKLPQDAIWWSYATITTVGYGDKFPVTTEGRIVAAVLMTAGVGLFSTLTALIASWFLTPPHKEIVIAESPKRVNDAPVI
jgi:voltage-gated potassium channel